MGTHRVVIIGGGFGGLYAAQSLRKAPVQVTLIDKRNFHLFQPLLYQVATGALSPANVAAPLRSIVKNQKNAKVLMGKAVDFDLKNRQVKLVDGEIFYDTLIVAAGSGNSYFGHSEWEKWAPGLKTVEDATEIRRRILLAFETAERETDPRHIQACLTFVIVGSGPTGVELAGALAEIAQDTLRHDFRSIDPTKARILLIEGLSQVLPLYPQDLSLKAAAALKRLGVITRTSTFVTDIQPDFVTVKTGEKLEKISARTVLWAAGVQASPLGRVLAEKAGVSLDRMGRLMVEPDLTLAGHPEIFVIGDLANFSHQTEKSLPGIAPVAMQEGRYAARLIQERLRGKTSPPFRYHHRGNMATIGRAAAVAEVNGLHFSGFFAWLSWLFIHLIHLVEFQNKLLVLAQWMWNYITRNRSARLITGENPFPLIRR
jgi:NADH dehydrogenase